MTTRTLSAVVLAGAAIIASALVDVWQGSQPARIVLVGDSTVTDEAGWGLAFRELLTDGVECINASAGGRSSKSFIDEGRWAGALALKGRYYLIQFGHNDQPGRGPERETDPATTYPEYLRRYVDEARAIGATPILVTSLTRRHFDTNGRIVSTLTPYVDAVKTLAAARRVPVIDLHTTSLELAERMGDAAWIAISPRLASGDVDRTHLNENSRALIAALVGRELRTAVPDLAPFIRPVAAPR
jgi:pectinesterase